MVHAFARGAATSVTQSVTPIVGCILAGGAGRRLGGRDKGLVDLAGQPLVAHCLERLRPQVDRVVISANRNHAAYRRFAASVIGDEHSGYAGPLAGLVAVMLENPATLIATVPCDCPFFPPDLVARLAASRDRGRAGIAVARTPARLQPVFALCSAELAADLAEYLAAGERKIDRWFARHLVAEVCFDDESAFANVNAPADLENARERLARTD